MMGKILVITGADFSENGIRVGETLDITSQFTLTRAYNFAGEDSSSDKNKYLNLVTPFSLSSYISAGYTQVTIKKVSESSPHSIAMAFCNSSRGDLTPPSPTYGTASVTVDLNSSVPYLLVGAYRNDGSTYGSATYAASAIMIITLYKP